jgi:hypothetical protein
MRGLLARFKGVRLHLGDNDFVPVVVWTSEGHAEVARAKIIPAKAPPAAAPRVALEGRQLIVGSEAEAKIAPPQRSFAELKVRMTAGRSAQSQDLEAAVLDQGGTIRFTPKAFTNAASGDAATARVMVKASPDSVLEPFGAPVSGVYYAKADDAKAQVAPGQAAVKALDKGFKLTYPAGAAAAFPGFPGAPLRIVLEAKTAGAPGAAVTDACAPAKDGKSCTFYVQGVTSTNLKAEAEYIVRVQAGDHRISTVPETVKITP